MFQLFLVGEREAKEAHIAFRKGKGQKVDRKE